MSPGASLGGKAALITGASGGLGAAIARALAREGCALALHYNANAAAARALARELSLLAPCAALQADLLNPRSAESLPRRALKALGRLDILVNNAGAVLGGADFSRVSCADFERTLRLNLTAPFLLARRAFPLMRRQGGGRILNVSSIAAKFGGSPRSMHYGAAKAGLEALTVSLARLGAPHGVLVNAVRAGVLDTPFHAKFRKDLRRRAALVPLKRLGRPEEVARMILFLAGPGGDFVTGQVLPVTGGE